MHYNIKSIGSEMRWYLTVTHISHCEINSVTANYYAAYM